jgi:hypothetical protein
LRHTADVLFKTPLHSIKHQNMFSLTIGLRFK